MEECQFEGEEINHRAVDGGPDVWITSSEKDEVGAEQKGGDVSSSIEGRNARQTEEMPAKARLGYQSFLKWVRHQSFLKWMVIQNKGARHFGRDS
jgi:hypothetical protein